MLLCVPIQKKITMDSLATIARKTCHGLRLRLKRATLDDEIDSKAVISPQCSCELGHCFKVKIGQPAIHTIGAQNVDRFLKTTAICSAHLLSFDIERSR